MQQIICVLCFDGAFARRAAVTITSLCVHAESDYKIYCLVSEVGDDDLKILHDIARRFHVEIVIVPVDNPFTDWQAQLHVSTVAYCRLTIPSVVPEPRAIYLDCDVLVTCDLKEMFEVDLGGALVAGCKDHRGGRNAKLKLVGNDTYINSGVLLLDLDRLRAEDFVERIRPTYQSHRTEFVSTDKCLINKLTEGRKHILDPRWNVMAHDRPSALSPVRAWCEPFDGKGILHFSGEVKPWHPWSGAWEAGLWQSYARLAGVPKEVSRGPVTVAEWTAVARKAEAEEDWRAAAAARKVLADYYRGKAISAGGTKRQG